MAGRLLKVLLRAGGCASLLAVVAVVMPRAWMAACHARLGLGELPAGAIVEYLARSLSAMYAIVGGLMLLAAGDLRRHAPVITYLGLTHIVFAAAMLAIDLRIGLPWYWTAGEVASAGGFGAAILLLQARMRPQPQPQ